MTFDQLQLKIIRAACCVLLAALIVTVAMAVLSRYVFSFSIHFAEPLSRYLFIWFSLLGCSLAFRAGAHITIAFFIGHLPIKIAKVTGLLTYMLSTGFFALMIYFGYLFAMQSRGVSDRNLLNMPMEIAYLAIPAGFLLMLIQCQIAAIAAIKKWKTVENPSQCTIWNRSE